MVDGQGALEAGLMFGNAFQARRVLVTGHTGFKGSWLTHWLTRLGAQVAICGLAAGYLRVMRVWEARHITSDPKRTSINR